MISGYLARQTFLHRISVGIKLTVLAAVSLALPFIHSVWPVLALLLAILVAYAACGREAIGRLKALRILLPVLILIGGIQGLTADWQTGLNTVARLLAMILLADLVTLSSTMQAMMAALQPLLRPLARVGLDPHKLALAVALVMRFIPYLLANWRERDEAWRARTGRRASWRMIAPFVGETLRLADRVAEALDARGIGIRSHKSE